jgi:SAM-dependent methyltransferase
MTADIPKQPAALQGVEKETILKRYEAESYDINMSRYLNSLDPALVKRMDDRVVKGLKDKLNSSGVCRVFIPAVGTGRVLKTIEPLMRDGVTIDCIDFNSNMTKAIDCTLGDSGMAGHTRIVDGDLMDSVDRYPKDSFDLVIWEYSGCLVPDPLEAWRVIAELCAPGALVIYNDYIGARDDDILRSQYELRDAARTIGMRWFRPEELPSYIDPRDPRLITTNGIISVLNADEFQDLHSIVWDPAYAFANVLSNTLFERSFEIVDMEMDVTDIMQSNVSSIIRKAT